MEYEVWIEGYMATGEHGTAQQLTMGDRGSTFKAESFKDACMMAMKGNDWNWKEYYNEEKNTFWGCRFFDNEADARKSFG